MRLVQPAQRSAARRANLSPKKSSHPRASQQRATAVDIAAHPILVKKLCAAVVCEWGRALGRFYAGALRASADARGASRRDDAGSAIGEGDQM
jgi:hypothetical protein